MYMYICKYMNVCIHIYIYIYMNIYIYIYYAYILLWIYLYIYKYMYSWIYKYVYMYLCIYLYMYIYIYAYRQANAWLSIDTGKFMGARKQVWIYPSGTLIVSTVRIANLRCSMSAKAWSRARQLCILHSPENTCSCSCRALVMHDSGVKRNRSWKSTSTGCAKVACSFRANHLAGHQNRRATLEKPSQKVHEHLKKCLN